MGVFRVLGILLYQLPPTPTYQGSVILQHFSVDAFVHPAAVVQQPTQTCNMNLSFQFKTYKGYP